MVARLFFLFYYTLSDVSDLEDCQQFINTPLLLISPSNPFYYGHVIPCTWSIDYLDGTFVRVDVLHINLAVPDTQIGLINVGYFFMYILFIFVTGF